MTANTIFLISVLVSMWFSAVGRVAGIPVTSLGWVVPLLVSLFYLIRARRLSKTYIKIWFLWCSLLLLYAVVSFEENAVQRTIILITPLVVGLCAASFKPSDRDLLVLFKYIRYFTVLVIPICYAKLFMAAEGAAMIPTEAILCVGLFVFHWTYYRVFSDKVALILAALLVGVPLLGLNRGPLLAIFLSVIFSLPSIGAVRMALVGGSAMLTFIAAVLLSPQLAGKMFVAGEFNGFSQLSSDDIATSGRFGAWEVLIDGIRSNPLFGHGANASEAYLVTQISEAFAHPHNDYLRLAFDYGVPVAIFYVLLLGIQVKVLLTRFHVSENGLHKFLLCVAISMFVPYLILMYFDNIVLYAAFFGSLHFYFVGLSLSRRF